MGDVVVKINQLEVEPGKGDVLEERFGSRLRRIEAEGFLGWELLRPTDEGQPYLAITRWESEAAFDAWRNGPAFHEGHKHAPEGKEPVARTAGLLSYEVAVVRPVDEGA
ncbi:MAG: antibiotic biosynthesis monooxygenase family protein [Actinomycetes bacterium]